jgi:hypothetical protein
VKLATLLVCLLIGWEVCAQPDSTRAVTPDTATAKYNFILIDTRYQNQFAFWGRNYGQKLPSISTNVMHYFHSGVWLSVSNFWFPGKSIPTQLGATLGYLNEVTPKLDWHLSYSQFYVPDESIPTAFKTQGYFQTTLGLDWGLLFSSVQAHALINRQSDVFFTTVHSRYFEFNKKLWRKVTVSFEPKLSFTAGTHHFEYADGLVIGPGGGIVTQPGTTNDEGGKIEPLNADFLFPLKFALGHCSVEPSWRYTLPFQANPDYPNEGLHIFAIAMNYAIPIKR